jgi:hypothetical protein
MQTLLRFALEQTILNFFAILLGIAAAVLLFGSLLDKRRTRPILRSLVYSLGGVVGGVWSYIAFDNEPTTQYMAVPVLALTFLLVCFVLITPLVYFRSRKPARHVSGGGT